MTDKLPPAARGEIAREAMRKIFADFQHDAASPYSERIQRAIYLARRLQTLAAELQTPQERRQQAELDRMMHHPGDKVTLMQMTDQAFRSTRAFRAADQLVHILDVQGVPRFFTSVDRLLLKGFQSFGNFLPGVAVPFVKEKMQQETANVILPAEQELLARHLNNRRQEGVRMNVNFLGEALLGENEANNRLRRYLQALQRPEIEVISVKISTIYSQISTLGREHTLNVLCDRLELLYRAAAKSTFTRGDGTVVPKFVYLDMEEYRDMEMTATAFMRTLDLPGLESASAGIALQSYVPDSFRVQQEITQWAMQRVARGGAPVTIRIVKGANMETERVEASLRGWPQAPYRSKEETDANYKRMVAYGMKDEHRAAVRLGIATHNLFEVAHALVLADECQAFDDVQFEMLEGMANHQRRAVFEQTQNMLLYAPACQQEDFIHAIGYLVRRLDENTGPNNFLRHAFRIRVDSPDWALLEKQFAESFDQIATVSDAPRRTQDRHDPPRTIMDERQSWQQLQNEPDTDFSLLQNVRWAEELLQRWESRCGDQAMEVAPVIDGECLTGDRPVRESYDPSRPGTVVARFRMATDDDIERAVQCAAQDPDGWRSRSAAERSEVLARAAQNLRVARADLMGAALAEGGKLLTESDPEVTEAVDFVEFYRRVATYFESLPRLHAQGRGVVVVVSPWNFPIAIPCGGIAAALAAGNTVILKPASDTVLVASLMCQCFWDAGVSRKTLQFAPCPGGTTGQRLVSDARVDTVVLTGGTETALSMMDHCPTMRLFAETGGKNATIVTSMADRDQAIRNVLHSAFGHAGQKCSATSLLILEEEVFQDAKFKETLCDAVRSLEVGSAWDLATRVNPLIRPPSGPLEVALKELEPGESWAVMPLRDEHNRQLYSPAVKWNVQPGSVTHHTEFFGPVLGVMRASDLSEAIELTNQTGYGLTSGIESLDEREINLWKERIRAGNLYINRGTTGAIVLRQPFGGMGKSSFGPGIKAGGPNYVAQLMRFEDDLSDPLREGSLDEHLAEFCELLHNAALDDQVAHLFPAEDRQRILQAVESYDQAVREEYGVPHDHFLLIGQDNIRRYLPVRELRVRVASEDSCFEILARICAARSVGCRVTASFPPQVHTQLREYLDDLTHFWAGAVEWVEETDDQLRKVIERGHTHRIRYAHPSRVPELLRRTAPKFNVYIADEPVLIAGRIELMWYVEEQSICDNYHRYGNLGGRADEPRHDCT
jgi:RHH-type proline utilization regulon transcriptional repressor/proline dehydrogenase/delta 1-pyrroline-5-carboxylate dehydrogenase